MNKLATVSSITLRREGVVPSLFEAFSFAEANLKLREWVDFSPKNDGYGQANITVRWENGGCFSLILYLEYPEALKKIDIKENIKYLIKFALGEVKNPAWTEEQNAHALMREQECGASEHCRLLRETCLLDDVLH